jgi:hypothetical protein
VARRGTVLLAGILLLSACSGAGEDGPRTPTPASSTPDRCAEAVSAIVAATQEYVDGFGPADAPQLPSPAASGATPAGPTPTTAPPMAGADTADAQFQAALATARTQLAQSGCDAVGTRSTLGTQLATVSTRGPVAGAVLRQLTATMTGTAAATATTRTVGVDDDLLTAVAQLPAGSTIELSEGVHRVDDVVVLLSPITIRGAGAERTTVESDVADFSVLAIADGVVALDDLTLRHRGTEPASVVLAGPTASLVVTGTTVGGGVADRDGTGGAGILMYDPAPRERRSATSLEVTAARFDDNGSAGVVLTGGHVASIAASTFTGNRQCGVCFLDASGGSVQDSTFSGNAVAVATTGSAAPTVLRATIRGGQVGIQAGDRSAPVVDASRISGASRAGLIWAGRAAGVIRGVRCSAVPFGLVVGPDVAPTVRDTTCAIAPSG